MASPDDTAPSDEGYASRIKSLVDDLNNATLAATHAGLHVILEVQGLHTMGLAPMPRVQAQVLRSL